MTADADSGFRAFSWDGALVRHSTLEAALAAVRADKPTWIDLLGRNADNDRLLGADGLDLHPLVIEDIFSDNERPKAEEFGEYLYVCVHAPAYVPADDHRDTIELVEMDIVTGDSYCLTHHRLPSPAIDAVIEELERTGRGLRRGAAWIGHTVLDRLIDDYMPLLDRLDEEVEGLENRVLTGVQEDVLPRIFANKRQLQQLRRVAVHQKEVLHRLGRGEFARIPEALTPFYRDVYDHFSRVHDLAESYRDVISSAMEAYLSVQSNRMNAIMKTLTLTATIFLPLSFVVGYYGMNFEHMPELHTRWGYPLVIALLVTVVVGMLALYRRKKWL
jgi:magnesium transporter